MLVVVVGLVTKLCLTLATPWTEEPGRLQSMGFSRQEYWSGLPFPSAGDLPNPGIEPTVSHISCTVGGFFPAESAGKPHVCMCVCVCIKHVYVICILDISVSIS